jgi:hypothetical protein
MNCLRFILICFLLFCTRHADVHGQTEQSGASSWSIGPGYLNYHSFSQQKISMPMRIGFPLYFSNTAMIEVEWHRQDENAGHRLSITTTLPSSVSSDNGTGRNEILDVSSSSYFRAGTEYQLQLPLLRWRDLARLQHGFTSGIIHESRELRYQSATSEQSVDINLYIGPAVYIDCAITTDISLRFHFAGRFYLPYLNYGHLTQRDAGADAFMKSSYHGFYYQSVLALEASWRNYRLKLTRGSMAGYATSEMGFGTEGIVHHKLDRDYTVSVRRQL